MNSASIFDWLHIIAGNVWLYGGAFLLVLGVLVFVHEWGHYIVARLCGVRIESFSIGFGPELFGLTDRRGTRWKFSAVPLGGYVKMFGDTDPASAGHSDEILDPATEQARPLTPEERKQAFYTQPIPRRAAIVFAGPAINFIFAIIVLAGLYCFYGEPITPPVAAAIIGGSPAETAGFLPQDEVIAIDGAPVHKFEDIKRIVMVGLDVPQRFSVRRDGTLIEITATPRRQHNKDRFGFKHDSGLLGLISPGNAIDISHIKQVDGRPVANLAETRAALLGKLDQTFFMVMDKGADGSDRIEVRPLSAANAALRDPKSDAYNHLVLAKSDKPVFVRHAPLQSLGDAVREVGDVIGSTFKALGQMITGTRSASELGGVIRIGAMAGDMAKTGLAALISFTALLSINLGLVNLFPIPMLDGGHLLFFGLEALRGKPVPERVQEYAFRVGLAILVGLMLFANINDIVQLIL